MTCLYHWWTQRGATIVYATHIFDGLETWATHLAYIQNGELNRSSKMADISEMKTSPNLLSVVESWLRSETKIYKKKKKEPVAAWKPTPFDNSPFRSSRHMAYYRWLVITDGSYVWVLVRIRPLGTSSHCVCVVELLYTIVHIEEYTTQYAYCSVT